MSECKIFLTCKEIETLREDWKANVDRWRHLHPGNRVEVWEDKKCQAFLDIEYPNLALKFKNAKYGIQRADMIRYALLYHFGGLYVDMDIIPLRCIDPFLYSLEEAGLKLGCISSSTNPIINKKKSRFDFSNSFMWSKEAKHPFWQILIKDIEVDSPRCSKTMPVYFRMGAALFSHFQIMGSSGSSFVSSRAYDWNKEQEKTQNNDYVGTLPYSFLQQTYIQDTHASSWARWDTKMMGTISNGCQTAANYVVPIILCSIVLFISLIIILIYYIKQKIQINKYAFIKHVSG